MFQVVCLAISGDFIINIGISFAQHKYLTDFDEIWRK